MAENFSSVRIVTGDSGKPTRLQTLCPTRWRRMLAPATAAENAIVLFCRLTAKSSHGTKIDEQIIKRRYVSMEDKALSTPSIILLRLSARTDLAICQSGKSF